MDIKLQGDAVLKLNLMRDRANYRVYIGLPGPPVSESSPFVIREATRQMNARSEWGVCPLHAR